MKKYGLFILAILLVIITVLTSACIPQEPVKSSKPTKQAEPKPIELSLASPHAPDSLSSQSIDRWIPSKKHMVE